MRFPGHGASLLAVCVFIHAFCAGAAAQRSTPFKLDQGYAGSHFGNAVAIDGDTLVVSDLGGSGSQGSAYVYRWTGSGWQIEAGLTASDGAVGDQFGIAVAISGDTVIVGAYAPDNIGTNHNPGSAYVFARSGATWIQQAKLTDGAIDDNFGFSVAISGDTAIVGANRDDLGANTDQGSAYVFVRSGTTWSQQARLTAPDGAARDRFGYSTSLSGDTAIVGAYQDDAGTNTDQGSAYVFVRSGTTWSPQAKLTAPDGAISDRFGTSVAISDDTAIVGSPRNNIGANNDQGSAYVFARSGTIWIQQAKLTASDGAPNDNFGFSVALHGDTACAGAYLDDFGANVNQGSAYVFVRSETTWTQQTQFTAPDGAANDNFGCSVAISGDTAVVGACLDDAGFNNTNEGSAWVFSRIGSTWIGPDLKMLSSDGGTRDFLGYAIALSGDTAIVGATGDNVGQNMAQGSAFVFVRSGTSWIQQAKLTASDGAAYNWFGSSVAIDGDTAIVGSPLNNSRQGAAYVFVRSGTTWIQQAKLIASDGAADQEFGSSVAISGETAVVGQNFGGPGSAYIFVRSGAIWTQQAKLTADEDLQNNRFGSAVAVYGDTVAVGAFIDTVGANFDQGSTYIFVRSGTTWSHEARLTASDGAEGDWFGYSVALSGDTLIAGSRESTVSGHSSQGAAYVFVRTETTWSQQAKLVASDGASFDQFGVSVALSGDSAAVGAFTDDVGANADQGSAYVFARSGTTWIQQAKFTAADGAMEDYFGWSVAVSDNAMIAGAYLDDTPYFTELGSAWVYELENEDLSLAHNNSTGDTYTTLGAALAEAQNGEQIFATEGAWRTVTPLDTAGRSLVLRGYANVRRPFGSSLRLGGGSTLTTADGSAMEFFGALHAGGTNVVASDAFLLGARGTLDVEFDALLAVASPATTLEGQTSLDVGATLTFAGARTRISCNASLIAPFVDDVVAAQGSFDCAIDSNTRFDLSFATLQLFGTGAEQTLEVMSTDIGADALGLDRTIAGHYPIGVLHIGPTPSTVRLVDARDNDNLGQGSGEAIYVDRLVIDAGSHLINPSCRIYYNALVNHGVVEFPNNLVSLGCPTDFNGDGFLTGQDFDLFVLAFEAGDASADFNHDGFLTGEDFDGFVQAFEAGC